MVYPVSLKCASPGGQACASLSAPPQGQLANTSAAGSLPTLQGVSPGSRQGPPAPREVTRGEDVFLLDEGMLDAAVALGLQWPQDGFSGSFSRVRRGAEGPLHS